MAEDVYVGQVTRSEIDPETGQPVARRIPWWESDTATGPTGKGTAKIKRRPDLPKAVGWADPIAKRTPQEQAADLAQRFVKQLQQMEQAAGRPLVPEDLSEEWLRAFGLEFWKSGQPITTEQMRSIAGIWLEAVKRGAGSDARFVPGPVVP